MTDGDDETVGEMSDGLQVELFHPESDRKPGDTNIQRWGFDVHPWVFPIALLLLAVFIGITLLMEPSNAETMFLDVRGFFEGNFGWFFLLSVNIFIVSIVYFALSKYGKIKIGGVEADKEFGNFAWMAMLFSAGMGIGLMFYSVAEPMSYMGSSPGFWGAGSEGLVGQAALAQTFFHWGFSPWAIYGLVGLGLAFFSFNRGLPLTFRSIFWPLLGERIYGWPGHVIDLITVFATIFGLATSLGLGVAQVNRGMQYVAGPNLLDVAEIPFGTMPQILLIAGITLIATISVAAGLEGGVKRLSTLNLYLMLILLGFVLLVGPTLFIFESWLQGMGAYFQNFLSLSMFTGAMGAGASTVDAWTVFYWAWWIAWSPFVGMFIARISKGRTVREFVVGVLVLPSMFSFIWLSAFGSSAIQNTLSGGGEVMAAYTAEGQTVAMFALLNQFPFAAVSGMLATLLVVTFFVTSSDSGSLVIDHLTSGGKHNVPRVQRIFWAIMEGTVAGILLWGGGLDALQAASLATGFPFAIILTLMVYTVYKGLRNEYEILESQEFAETIQDLSDEDDVDVVTAGDTVVTDVSSDEPTRGD